MQLDASLRDKLIKRYDIRRREVPKTRSDIVKLYVTAVNAACGISVIRRVQPGTKANRKKMLYRVDATLKDQFEDMGALISHYIPKQILAKRRNKDDSDIEEEE